MGFLEKYRQYYYNAPANYTIVKV